MNNEHLLKTAADFLRRNNISFVDHGGKIRTMAHSSEVCFLVPDALDPSCVIDPPDVRVMVYHDGSRVELVTQM